MPSLLLPACVIKPLLALVLTGLFYFIARIFYRNYAQKFDETSHAFNFSLFQTLYKPLVTLLIGIGAIYVLKGFCGIWGAESIEQELLVIRYLLIVSVLAWFSWSFVSRYGQIVLKQIDTHKIIDKTLVYGLSRVTKIAIVILTLLSLFQLFGLDITGMLAFGGIGGVIVGFAAKDLLANLFSSFMIFCNRPFVIGDKISLPTLKIEGIVEEINWRTCKLRTSASYMIDVPNTLFSTLVIANRSRMKARRLSCKVYLYYQDFTNIPALLKEIEALLKGHSILDKTRSILMCLDEFGSSFLQLQIVAYVPVVNDEMFYALRQALYLDLISCFRDYNLKWTFSTS